MYFTELSFKILLLKTKLVDVMESTYVKLIKWTQPDQQAKLKQVY